MEILHHGVIIPVLLLGMLFLTGVPGSSLSETSSQKHNAMLPIGEIVSELNFSVTVVAGRSALLSRSLISFRAAPNVPSPSPQDVWYEVTRAPPAAFGRLSKVESPSHQVWRFSQSDVDELRVLFIPPESTSTMITPAIFEMRSIHASSGMELAPSVTLQIRVRAADISPPAFRWFSPVLHVKQGAKLDIDRRYFEIADTDNSDPNLMFVITEIPRSGSLVFINEKNIPSNIIKGFEFYLQDLRNGFIQYELDNNKIFTKDTFEVLATDGNFELTNVYTLEEIAGENAEIPENISVVQFEYAHLVVPYNSSYVVKFISLNVIRTGNILNDCIVHVNTKDGNATRGIHYETLFSKAIRFGPGVTQIPVHVNLIFEENRNKMDYPRFFYLILDPKSVVGAQLGAVASVAIVLEPYSQQKQQSKVFPLKPLVVSLQHYPNITNNSHVNMSPGYPLVCVSSCDKNHPHFKVTRELCASLNISSDGNDTSYSWEVIPGRRGLPEFSSINIFYLFGRDNIYDGYHSKILDPSLFSQNYKVRCSTTPISEANNDGGFTVTSKYVVIGGNNISTYVCPKLLSKSSNKLLHRDKTYTAKINFINESEEDHHRNRIHINVEIPHYDGVLPIISTSPLSNIESHFNYRLFKHLHECSNLPPQGIFLYSLPTSCENNTVWKRQENNSTRYLYKHLNLSSCKWVFEAWFDMNTIIDSCHGKIHDSFQDARNNNKWMNIGVPLFIALHHADEPTEYHQTLLQISFIYSSLLGKGVKFYNSEAHKQNPSGHARVLRLRSDAEGRLRMELETNALFPGHFVLRHPEMPKTFSLLQPPPHVPSPFALSPVGGHRTSEKGIVQKWKATSAFSLQDYSGEYWLILIPCWNNVSELLDAELDVHCFPFTPLRIQLLVRFRRQSAPAPLRLRLATRLVLTKAPLTSSFPSPAEEQDRDGAFSREDTVFACVQLLPISSTQPPPPALRLRIETVVLCAASIHQPAIVNCAPSPQSLYSPTVNLVLLSKKNIDDVDILFHEKSFNASFVSDTPQMKHLCSNSNEDGFIFSVEPLYASNAEELSWYLEVTYSVEYSARQRTRRSIEYNMKRIEHFDGKTVRSLNLLALGEPVNFTSHIWSLTLGPALFLLFIPLLVVSIYTKLNGILRCYGK